MAKRISNQQFYDFTKYSYDCGIKHLKMYYILGLSDQSLDEVQHIIDFIKDMNPRFKAHDLNVIIAFFIPKCQTPCDRIYIGLEQVDLIEKQAKMSVMVPEIMLRYTQSLPNGQSSKRPFLLEMND